MTTCAPDPYSGTAMGVAAVLLLGGMVLLVAAARYKGRAYWSTVGAACVCLLVAVLLMTGVLG